MSVIQIQNLTFGYDGSAANVFENVSLRLDTDWKLGLTGRNGRGKTTFLKLLAGSYEYRGTISATVNFVFPLSRPRKRPSCPRNSARDLPRGAGLGTDPRAVVFERRRGKAVYALRSAFGRRANQALAGGAVPNRKRLSAARRADQPSGRRRTQNRLRLSQP